MEWDGDPRRRLDSLTGVIHHFADAWERRGNPNRRSQEQDRLLQKWTGRPSRGRPLHRSTRPIQACCRTGVSRTPQLDRPRRGESNINRSLSKTPSDCHLDVLDQEDEVELVGRALLELRYQMHVERPRVIRFSVHQQSTTADAVADGGRPLHDIAQEACAEPPALVMEIDAEPRE